MVVVMAEVMRIILSLGVFGGGSGGGGGGIKKRGGIK
jgi:hypothetical protein